MNSNFTTGFNKPSIFTAQTYGTKTTVEVDHSDLSLDEVMDAFQTLIIGMGYHENSFKNWVIERANEYNETDAEDLKEKLEAWKFEDDDIVLRHSYLKDSEGYESMDELENDFFGTHDSEGYESNIDAVEEMKKYAEEEMEKEAERRMDIIGQNGNEGLHYRATQEDEDEFSNDGGFDGKPHFEWGDEPEDDENLFEGDEWKPNQKLAEANERYKSEVKKMKSKKRNNKN
jgi:hypothetical protein